MSLQLKTRPIRSTDHSLIHDSWTKTAKRTNRFVDKRLFQTGMNQRIEKILALCEATHGGFVACDPEDEDQVLAFQVITVPVSSVAVIEFAFTKALFWRMGLQKYLLNQITETTKIVSGSFSALTHVEFQKDEKPLVLQMRDDYGIVYDPFFFERLAK